MKIIGVCCSCLPKSISQKAVKEFLRGAQENGHETELIQISKNLSGCTGCHACKKADTFCVQNDVLKHYFEILPDADADRSALVRPVYVVHPVAQVPVRRMDESHGGKYRPSPETGQ